jgi:lysophospholipase L1-like esterase
MVFAIDKRVFSDIENHWASEVIEVWYAQDLVKGYPDGSFKPDNSVTRAEFISMVNNIYGYSYKTTQYMDIDVRDWYYSAATIAKSNGYMDWHNSPYFYGNQAITREEVCAILYQVIQLEITDSDKVLSFFTDDFNDWSKDYIASLVEAGYLSGYPDKSFRASHTITRAESVVMLNQVMGTIYDTEGTYDGEYTLKHPKNVTITSPDVQLSNMVIVGDLILAAGIGNGDVELTNITVLGRTIVNGGGLSTITITNCNLGPMIVLKYGDSIRIISEESYIESIEQLSQLHLEGDFKETIIRVACNDQLILDGDFKELIVDERATIELSPKTFVDKAVINADASITGEGKLAEVELNNDDAIIEVTVDKYTNILVVIEDEETPQGAVAPPTSTPPSSGGTPPTGGTTPPVVPPTNTAPVNTVLPNVNGVHQVGQTLSANLGSWTDNSSYSLDYYWELTDEPGNAIEKLPKGPYTIKLDDLELYIRIAVTANDGILQTTKTSSWIQINNVPNTKPNNTSLPSVDGLHQVNQKLVADKGNWEDNESDEITLTHKWELSDSDVKIEDATIIYSYSSTDYTLKEVDAGLYIRIKVTADDGVLSGVAYSEWKEVKIIPNEPPENTERPFVIDIDNDNRHIVEEILVANKGIWNDDYTEVPTLSYIWEVSESNLENALIINTYPEEDHILVDSDVGKYIRIKVTADDGELNSVGTSVWILTSNLPNEPPEIVENPSISDIDNDGVHVKEEVLVANTGSWTDDYTAELNFSYVWELSETNTNIENPTLITTYPKGNHTLGNADVGNYIRIKVTANDGDLTTDEVSVWMFVNDLPNEPPENVSIPIVSDLNNDGEHVIEDELVANVGTWTDDKTTNLEYRYIWEVSASNTETENPTLITTYGEGNHLLVEADVNNYIRIRVTADDGDLSTDEVSVWMFVNDLSNTSPYYIVEPEVIGEHEVSKTLEKSTGTWEDSEGDNVIITSHWEISATADDNDINEIISDTHTLTESDLGKYIRVQISVEDDNETPMTTEYVSDWKIIKQEEVDYVSLGDSISNGYVHILKTIAPEDRYVNRFGDYLETKHPLALVNMNNFSREGDDTGVLLSRIRTETQMRNQILDAEVITICIGGNNLLNAAKDGSFTGYNFDNIDEIVASQGLTDFNEDFPQIISEINLINSNALIIVMTMYNPYKPYINPDRDPTSDESSDDMNYNLVNAFFDTFDEQVGMNNKINEQTSQYHVADVYTAYHGYAPGNNQSINLLTDMDRSEGLFRNPHPNVLGQTTILLEHERVYLNWLNAQD